MKKIILSAVVAAMALTTTASALEDIKVNGKAKLWYETKDAGTGELFTKAAPGNVSQLTFELGMTGKQGNVNFGVKVIDASNLELLGAGRDATADAGLTVNEAYITAPIGSKTTVKIGKQQIQTPLAFSENWASVPNTFNAALVVNKATSNLTLVGAYVAQQNTKGHFRAQPTHNGYLSTASGGAAVDTFAAVAHYKTDAFSVNAYGYELSGLAKALWIDAGTKVGPVALKVVAATIMAGGAKADALNLTEDTTAFALSAGTKLGSVSVSAAASTVSDDKNAIPVANTATDFKKTKLPTAGVYTDGKYVAQPGSTAFKLKAVTKIGGFKVIAQGVMNSNDIDAAKETTEIDLILIKKIGDFNFKAIALNRSFDDKATDDARGGNHFRLITSVNF